MSSYVIHPIVCGLNATDQGVMTYLRHYGKAIHIPIYVFYLEGGDKKILIDSGLEDFLIPEGLEDELGLRVEYLEDGLARLGVTPEEIDIIIHTHLHNDHCENDGMFPNAKIYVQRAELEFCRHPHPLDHRYDADYLEGCAIVELDGPAEVAPGVSVLPTPGHSPGGQSVVVQTAQSGKALITGFCCNDKNFPPSGPAVAPGVHTDAIQAWESANLVKSMLESGQIDLLIPCHALWPGQKGPIA
ncbi:beta-lactamase domain protein [Desulfarculus baarsii DSM 2075]|uniref:Beta-lactamase domain protein n=1 Tax=Desulfarculus baarsii (strain ATCC 33931 / DSM 2075 / LMG 7858 / VKM B-1802 / 2st14) TaxID=644282 RepID=E1QJ20_DESB2|nr:N-acyl homoserine lactonase family protein [Desulfarculus baarsii]ADK85563.1 beta-lactamase domain protein [Desulfarculus baarsii DSM 2075]